MTDGDVSNHVEDTIFKVSGETLEMSDRMVGPLRPSWMALRRRMGERGVHKRVSEKDR